MIILNKAIKNILIFPNPKNDVPSESFEKVEKALSENGISSRIFEKYEDISDLSGKFDAIIALGGDGTMLAASKIAFAADLPILGINHGTLGYMSELEMEELDLLSKLKGQYVLEPRMLLEISVIRNGQTEITRKALNEAVITRDAGSIISVLSLECDGSRVCTYKGDGLIVATPTGSSGYAMSAGGPIIDTKIDAFCVCPVCPHIMATRPLIFSPNSVLEVTDMSQEGSTVMLSADGRIISEIKIGDKVSIKKSDSVLSMIRLKKDAFYDVLYKKMS